MPGLNTKLHVGMLRASQIQNSLPVRLLRAFAKRDVYGLEWGDPDRVEPLKFIRERYLTPYVNPEHTAVEIGPGGGRWTRYMLGFKRLYVVDYYPQLLEELQRTLQQPNLTIIKNNGTDFPGIPDESVDFVFTFGTFVHLDAPLIESYLDNLKRIVRPNANLVIHYSDKNKVMAQQNISFSENTPERMRPMVKQAGYQILEEDVTTMWHSSIMRIAKGRSTAATRRSFEVAGIEHSHPIPGVCRVGPLVMTSAVTGKDPGTDAFPGDIERQCEQMFANVRALLKAGGATPGGIIKMTVWLKDKSLQPYLNQQWVAMFPDAHSRPARHTFTAPDLDPPMLVQCEVMAVIE
jgi:enamine deaminase RidA (YjgF/YER057c/UK114 family)